MVLERLAIAVAITASSTTVATAVRFRLGSCSAAAAASDQCFSSSSSGLARPALLRSTVESFLLRWGLALALAAATPGQKRA